MLKSFRMFPTISAASYPPGKPAPKAQIIQAKTPEDAVAQMKRRHRDAHVYTPVSEWNAVEERD